MTDSEGMPVAGGDFSAPVPDAVVATAIAQFDSQSEEALALRYGRRARKHEQLVFEFTRDPALLHQYYRIYEEQFRAVHHANRYRHTVEDEHDRRSHFIIVRQGNLCVGGARLSVKTPRQPNLLPIEIDGFRLEDHFPQLRQKQMRYAQIGRFCLLPEFRGSDTTRILLSHLYRKCVALGMDVIFGTAPISNARAYMKNFVSMGLNQPKIHFDIELPKYPMCEEIKFYLVSVVADRQAVDADDLAEETVPSKEDADS